VAIDDFGVGYSSLSYLKHYPATRLKIDRLFVSDLPQSEAIARAIIAVAKSLGIALVAEGVETQEQAQVLVRLGCDVAQGFYYQRSVPASVLQIRYATERS
jgi:EAL domain-containing protein (putative c-di-GMP-specific phosphodiesterase class I)